MTIKVALTHETRYRFDRPVMVSPHEIRLRPAPHCRTPVSAYSLKISPAQHFLNWQQDPYGNWIARAVFPERTSELKVVVDLVADLTVINPFDFFVESYAENYPFSYPDGLRLQLMPYLAVEPPGPLRAEWLARFKRDTLGESMPIANMLVAINSSLQRDVGYIVRMEPGVQTPEQTLQLAIGSCRDTGWLLVQLLRDLGIAARFVSGYLMQIAPDQKPLDGPAGPEKDFADLHAWAEAFVPGAGWVGLDPTSGLLAGEGHIPLACSESPGSAAPITGSTEVCQVDFGFDMQLRRIYEDPRVTKPFTPEQWQAVDALGDQVDVQLKAWDVRLTMGGEPTFVSIDDMDGVEWNLEALGEDKRKLAGELLLRLKNRFAPSGVLHYGQGKSFPGEPLPRWALGCLWRADGKPLWKDARLLAQDGDDLGQGPAEAQRLAQLLAARLGVDTSHVMPAYEDVWRAMEAEQKLPADVDPLKIDLASGEDRSWLAKLLNQGLDRVAAYVLPLKASRRPRQEDDAQWLSSRWPLKREHLYLVPGDSPAGYRLPLDSLPKPESEEEPEFDRDPFEERDPLHEPDAAAARQKQRAATRALVRTALCVDVRGGSLHVFLPPVRAVEDWIDLVSALESTAAELGMPVVLEGYAPPADPRVCRLFVTPDPGVIEVNIHPAGNWRELTENTAVLYEEARNARLGTEKFMLDGRHTGTGGGNHVTIGGPTAAESPLLRRPDLVRSLVTYWQNHPALSYLFSGLFIGPTSQAPRVDEARDDNLYELEIAFQEMDRLTTPGSETPKPWLVDRLLRNFLVDLTGNTHRAEFSIDKLYSPHGPTGRLGLLEFRAFEMPPHWQMASLQMLLLRALIARFWKTPYRAPLVAWGTSLHDRFMLPHFVAEDFRSVIHELNEAGYAFRIEWFAPFFEFRFPFYGLVSYDNVELELRQALEPWHVLGEEAASGASTRYVDASVERLQVKVGNLSNGRYIVACNGRPVPLASTGRHGEFVAAVRFKAWQPPSALHPTIRVHAPLVFDIVDTYSGRSIGGCTYHVAHPGGRNYETLPVNAFEAEARRVARFMHHGHTPGPMRVQAEQASREFPFTLDLRRQAGHGVVFESAIVRQAAQQQQQ
ncbi:MAG: transglutaminase family protein [Burkholderiales bacterium]